MSKKKKGKLISLGDYRKKKQRLNLKNSKKAVSDENIFFPEEEEQNSASQSENFQDNKKAEIHYMDNYRKLKNTKIEEQQKDGQKDFLQTKVQEKLAKIFKLSDYRKLKQNRTRSFNSSESSEPINLEDYRKNKKRRQESLYRKAVVASKQAVSVGAMALMMFFAINIFFPEGQNDMYRRIASPTEPLYEDDFSKNKNNENTVFIKGTEIDQKGNKIKRGLSSLLNSSNEEEIPLSPTQRLKNKDFTNQEVFIGTKPSSSTYTGY